MRHRQWHLSGWPAVLLAPIAIPVMQLVSLVSALLGRKHTADLTAAVRAAVAVSVASAAACGPPTSEVCDFAAVGSREVARRFPEFDEPLPVELEDRGSTMIFTYQWNNIGGVPVVEIDKRRCRVVRSYHGQ